MQIVKSVGAAVAAWGLAVAVFDLPQPFLAPWAALLTVHGALMLNLRNILDAMDAVADARPVSVEPPRPLGLTPAAARPRR
jgi:hypothetical protein